MFHRVICTAAISVALPLMSSTAAAQVIQPGDVLISNHGGSNVQQLRPSTGVVTTLVSVAGTPIGLAFDTNGKLYINVNNGIDKYDPTTRSEERRIGKECRS